MKFAAAALLSLLPATAFAAGPEDAYFASRDAAIAQMAKLDADKTSGDAYSTTMDKDNAALEALLRPLVGSIAVKGFAGAGKLNLESLSKTDEGYGTLDGLAFTSADGKATLVATTAPIFSHWLAEHQNWWGKGDLNPPQTAETALKSSTFYTQAMPTDAAFYLFAELAVAKPAKADYAIALLAGRSQADTPEAPDEIVVAVITGGRVLIEDAPALGKIAAAPACAKRAKAADAKIQAAEDAYVATDRKNDALAAEEEKLRADTESALRSCFQDKAKGQKGFAAARVQAQGLIDAMVGD